MTRIVLDIEGDNLHPFVSRIFCVGVLDTETDHVEMYLEDERERFIRDSLRWTEWITHNGIGYDYFALWKLWGIEFGVGPDTVNGRPVIHTDTLVMSRYLNPDRIGGHSLDEWGSRLWSPKLEHKDFTQYSEEMRIYCEQDLRLTYQVYKAQRRERLMCYE